MAAMRGEQLSRRFDRTVQEIIQQIKKKPMIAAPGQQAGPVQVDVFALFRKWICGHVAELQLWCHSQQEQILELQQRLGENPMTGPATIHRYVFSANQRGDFVIQLPIAGEIVDLEHSGDEVGLFVRHPLAAAPAAPLVDVHFIALPTGGDFPGERFRSWCGRWEDNGEHVHLLMVHPATQPGTQLGSAPSAGAAGPNAPAEG